MIRLLILFIGCIPDLIRLIEIIKEAHDEAQVKNKIKLIGEAYESKDIAKLNNTFNS